MNTEVIDILEGFLTDEIELVEEDFGAAEALVIEKMRLLGRGFLQRLADRRCNGYKGSSIGCSCGGSMRFVGHRGRNVHTVFGWIRIKRAYYHCPDCGTGLCPYDRSSGLGDEQLSPALAKASCLLAVDDSFQQSSEKLSELSARKFLSALLNELFIMLAQWLWTSSGNSWKNSVPLVRSRRANSNPDCYI